jgi:DNA-binding LacI/PurR family transcriptional regulator
MSRRQRSEGPAGAARAARQGDPDTPASAPATAAARPPTILDVARVAGVSKSTVSNVIRDASGVRPALRARVFDAVAHLGYRPNVVARQLASRRTNVLGIVAGDLANPFYAEMAKLIERQAAAEGFGVMFCNTEVAGEVDVTGLETLVEHQVAGVAFLSYLAGSARARQLVDGRIPAVFVTCHAEWGDVVAGDDAHGAWLATEHLLSLGHRRIAYFADPIAEDPADRDRQAGFAATMRKAGLDPVVLRWRSAPDRVLRDGRETSLAAALGGADRLTAIFAANDLTAIEVLDAADRLGIAVPGQLSVVGFDDLMLAGLARINLTSVAQPKGTMARLAVQTIAGRVRGALTGPRLRQIVDLALVVRGSTAPPTGA